MGYRNLQACVQDLERTGQLVRVAERLDPRLEIPAIQRRLYAAQAPAILFEHVSGSSFPMLANLFGTLSRCEYIFRDAISLMEQITTLAIDPTDFLKRPKLYLRYTGLRSLLSARFARPQWVSHHSAPVLACQTQLSQLPQLISWPNDGGAYLTLPQVYSESPSHPGTIHSNLGMYRVQISGGDYLPNREAGIHYQIHRGLGIHHAEAIARGQRLPIRVWLGGPPAMTLAAVMPMPEDSSELTFAGLLGRRRVRLTTTPSDLVNSSDGEENQPTTLPIAAEADFCICGSIGPNELKTEGPFGDHLGYYSLAHPFPVMRVDRVYHRRDAIFPFTVVGRPPQEDTVFGTFIHRVTGPLIPKRIPGIREVHAVDAAGVHPLLLAIGQERYMPFDADRTPRELLTLAHLLLGSGQLSLAKYLLIASANDAPTLTTHDVASFFRHVLERANWQRDLHFITQTTMDTLDYTGGSLNHGSKLIVAATGPAQYQLATEIAADDWSFLPSCGCTDVRVILPGVVVVQAPTYQNEQRPELEQFCHAAKRLLVEPSDLSHSKRRVLSRDGINSSDGTPRENCPKWRAIVWVDDAASAAHSLDDFLWTTFTRSDPAADIFGVESFTRDKHWGCRGPLVIDARRRPYHAPELEEDASVTRRIESIPSLARLWSRG